jgi:putative membrane protein
MWGGGWGMGWFFPLMMLFFIAICIAGLLFGHRWGGGQRHWGVPGHMMGPGPDPTSSALQILNERFAKGEIQKEEYEEKKAVIRSSSRN